MLDFFLYPLLLSGGFALGWYAKPPVLVLTPSVSPGRSSGGVYVRFTRQDGSVEVKKIAAKDLLPYLNWKGCAYQAGEKTPDGHIYNEVVSG
jgi:hypothetical protein